MAPVIDKWAPTLHDTVRLAGGWDQLTPTLSLPSGVIRDSVNFECAANIDAKRRPTGGYTRIAGYERYDGRPSPSSATYSLVQVVTFDNIPSVGQTLTGQTSGATGLIIAVSIGSTYMILTKVVGTFTTSEVVKVGATTIGTATPSTTTLTALLNAQYTNLAADQYRVDIAAVPGSGPVRGIFTAVFSGVDNTYAFRDNAGGTATILYKSSGSGWTLVPFYNEVSFTAGGVTAPADGATLTQGANTATIKRVVLQSGSWAAGTAAGRFIVTTPAPGNFAAGAATIGAVAVTLSGVQTAITFAPGGKFEFDQANFSGQQQTKRVYGCDNVNRGFEFDGDTLTPITTGTSPDAPKYVRAHANHLFWAFQSSAIYSAPGLPYNYQAVAGAGELPCGDTITGFLLQPGAQTTATLLISTMQDTLILYGLSASTWNLVPFNRGIGALDRTQQVLADAYVLDDAGIFGIKTSLDFGNFEQATISSQIQTFINDKRAQVAYSSVWRGKSQYRLFFNDGTALYVTIVNGVHIGSAKQFFPNIVYCAWNGMRSNGNEVGFFGATDGFVYELEKGSSFDGADLEAYLTFNWNSMKDSRMLKQFRRASFEMQGNFYASILFGYQLGYGTTEIDQPSELTYESGFQVAPPWDAFIWDSFTWDGRTLFPTECEVDGTAENIQVTLRSATDYIYPFTVNSMITHYTNRRGMR
jgi:hypothetical protein